MDDTRHSVTQLNPMLPVDEHIRAQPPHRSVWRVHDLGFHSLAKRRETIQSTSDLVGVHLEHVHVQRAVHQPRRVEGAAQPHRGPTPQQRVVMQQFVVPGLEGFGSEGLEQANDFGQLPCDFSYGKASPAV